MLTTVLEIAGVLLLIAFAAVVWWPSALAVAGVACLAAAWVSDQPSQPNGPGPKKARRR